MKIKFKGTSDFNFKKIREDIFCVMCFVAFIIVIVLIFVEYDKQYYSCEKNGGMLIKGSRGSICITKEQLNQLKGSDNNDK